jgi:ATP-dependent RNA helicase DDX18/HAS1
LLSSTIYFEAMANLCSDTAATRVLQALAALGITRPSKIQAASYQSVLEGHHCVIAEQTGSGKTLAYLLPLVQR